jgi:hypothetical protein
MSYHYSEDEADTGILETRLMNRGFARRGRIPPHPPRDKPKQGALR